MIKRKLRNKFILAHSSKERFYEGGTGKNGSWKIKQKAVISHVNHTQEAESKLAERQGYKPSKVSSSKARHPEVFITSPNTNINWAKA